MDGIKIRELRDGDLDLGFLESLDSLRPASGMDTAKAGRILESVSNDKNHIVAVAVADGRIVGTATLLVEQKFIHGGGLAGHIEDVAVREGYQGNGVGPALVRFLLKRAEEAGCYKTVLACSDDTVPFYEGLGFRRSASEMRTNHG